MKRYLNRLVLNDMRRAIEEFGLIEDGDRVAVGLSGGKDSITLLYALRLLRDYSNMKFTLLGIHIDNGMANGFDEIEKFCSEQNIDIHIEKTNIREQLDFESSKSACYMCARLRKGALKRVCKDMGYNKIALGHHMDDAVETFFMNMIYTGKLGSFAPIITEGATSLIRPMVYVKEESIIKISDIEKLPVAGSSCPLNGETKRDEVSDLIMEIQKKYPDIKEKVVSSLSNVRKEGIWENLKGEW